MRREKEELTGVLGGVAAGNEEKWMEHQLAQLEETLGRLLETQESENGAAPEKR